MAEETQPALTPGAVVRINGGQYKGFVGRVLLPPSGAEVRVAVVLFGAEHDVSVATSEVDLTDEPAPRARVARLHDDGTIR